MAKTLTIATLDKIKPAGSRMELPDGAQPGLYFIVQPSGARSWAVRYRHDGAPRKHTLGSYPKFDLKTARELARVALRAASEGRDPAHEKAEARRVAASGLDKVEMFEAVWDEYKKRHPGDLRKATADHETRLFEKRLIPAWKKRRISEIKKRDVLDILDGLVRAGFPSAANRALAVMTTFFGWLVDRDVIQVSPCAGLKPPSALVARERSLSDDELRWLWKAASKDAFPFGQMIQLLVLTGARRDEVRGIVDPELNLSGKVWTLPKERAKNNREHEVHLSDFALRIIETIPRVKTKEKFLFSTNGETAPSGFSRAKKRIEAMMLEFAQKEAIENGTDPKEVRIPNWVVHDLRRTVATGMARLGIALPVVEKCLNHISGSFAGIVGVYQKHEFGPEKKIAFEKWSDHVATLVGEKPSKSNVTPMRRAKAK